jgi:hypothetical protein
VSGRRGLLLALLFAATAAVGALACSDALQPSSEPSACPGSQALWVASDYSSSAVGALSASGKVWSTTGRVDLGADPALAISNGEAFYVARDLDQIFQLSTQCGAPISQINVHQAGQTGSSNPQDVAVASDGTLWVPLYNVPTLLVLSPSGTILHTIDLSSYDSDGNPDAMGVEIVDTPAGEKAFVPLQRLDNANDYAADQPSWMLRLDVPAATVEATIVLAGRNPFDKRLYGSILWLAEPGNFDDATEPSAGVERFDTSTSTTALVAHELDLGGSVAEVAVSGSCGVAIVADATTANVTSLVTFDATSGAPIDPASMSPLTTGGPDGGYDLEGLEWVQNLLLLGDRRRATDGYPIHTFVASSACGLTPQPDGIFLPLPPVSVRVP